MQKVSISRLTLAAGMTSMISPAFAADAGFITDATATLQARNYYFSRDFSDIVGPNQQSKAEEGAGFILNFRSGYTLELSASAPTPSGSWESSSTAVVIAVVPACSRWGAMAARRMSTAAWGGTQGKGVED